MEIFITPKINLDGIKDYEINHGYGSGFVDMGEFPEYIFKQKGVHINGTTTYRFKNNWKPSKKSLRFDKNWYSIEGETATFTIEYSMDGVIFYTQTNMDERGYLVIPTGEVFEIKITPSTYFSAVGYENLNIVAPEKVKLNIVNETKIKINYSTIDIGKIGDVKRGYINNILVKQDGVFIDSFNFINEQTEFIFKNLFDGNEVTVVDNGVVFTGKILLKEIIFSKENDEPYLNFIINTNESYFFNGLSGENLDIPYEYISNTVEDKRVDIAKSGDQHEADESTFFYGYVNTNKGTNGHLNLNQTKVKGYFRYDSTLILTTGEVNPYYEENLNMVWAQGHNTYLDDLTPIFRVKELFKQLHSKYGYKVSGDFLDDPTFYNLGINPTFNYKYEAIAYPFASTKRNLYYDGINPTVFHRKQDNTQLSYVNNHKVGTSTSYYTTPYKVTKLITPKYEGIESEYVTANSNFVYTSPSGNYLDNSFLFGRRVIPCDVTDMTGYEYYYIEDVLSTFAGSRLNNVEFKIDINFDQLISDPGREYQFRVTISDHLIDMEAGTVSNLDMCGNPYSFAVVQDYEVEKGANLTNIDMEQMVFNVRDLLIPKITATNKSRYVIKVNVVSNVAAAHLGEFEVDVYINCAGDGNENEMGTFTNIPNAQITPEMMVFDFSEKEFMKEIITRFNLIPTVNEYTKEIEYKRFDNHFTETVVLDDFLVDNLSKKLITNNTKIKDNYVFKNNVVSNVQTIGGDHDVNIKKRDGNTFTIKNTLNNLTTLGTSDKWNEPSATPTGELIDPLIEYNYKYSIYKALPYDGMTIDKRQQHSSMDFPDFYAQLPIRVVSPLYDYYHKIYDGFKVNELSEPCNSYSEKLSKCYLGYYSKIDTYRRSYNLNPTTLVGQQLGGTPDFGNTGLNTENISLYTPSDTVGELPIVGLNNECILSSTLYRNTPKIYGRVNPSPYITTDWYQNLETKLNGNQNQHPEAYKSVRTNYELSYENELKYVSKNYRELEMYLILNKYPDELLDKVLIINNEGYIIDKISNFKINTPSKFNLSKFNINLNGYKEFIMDGYETNVFDFYNTTFTLFSVSPGVTFASASALVSSSTDMVIGLNLLTFEEGKEYTVDLEINGTDVASEFMGYYTNGSSNGYVIDSTFIGVSTQTISFTYTRQAPPLTQKSAVLAQTIKLKAGSYEILGVKVRYKQ